MVKVLIYSSKEIYDNASYEGRAEADVVAYRDGLEYVILKNRTTQYMSERIADFTMARILKWAERDEWEREIKDYKLCQEMKNHPYIELSKNAEVAQR